MTSDTAALLSGWPGRSSTEPPAAGRRPTACTVLAGRAAEPMIGRAPELIHSWLLVEHPGPWPREVLALEMRDLALSLPEGWRPLLIRRPGGRGSVPGRCLVVREGQDPLVARFADHAELAAADLQAVLDRATPESLDGRLVLVCTHGRRDACCAEFGRPVLRALQGRADLDVWECTHLGGDRYAGTMLVLPEGLYFSRLDGSAAVTALEELGRGCIALEHFRGRPSLSQPVQVLEHAARQLGLGDSARGPSEAQATQTADGRVRARLRLDGRLITGTLREADTPVADRTSSCDTDPREWQHWVLDELAIEADPGGAAAGA